ncbi:RyR domain-containing protein [Lysinibacillus endophyticus]|uniref:Ryanodine receptor Ryr n=1 Tax=Ureibacillus endophyticus TaxID=1978490 RepID=A0A494YS33_9BACL|nr:RyR domain-containing protein [Lysinibacillus endophyticus]MCP1144679.1 RyR domain-containing protein [Lysinibacillus endophyticus]RKQ12471.1 Ryanodine receptor Ryr [Lysinibacillus endophyticus]
MAYSPKPIDTSQVELSPEILELTELLAEHIHDVWAQERMKDGWQVGEKRDDDKKLHPGLVPYHELSDREKDYDRETALQSLKAILALGYKIEKK